MVRITLTLMETGPISSPSFRKTNCGRHCVTIFLNVIIGNATYLEDVTQIALFNEKILKNSGLYISPGVQKMR